MFELLLCSAVEVERVLKAHPGVKDCAVVGTPDPIWGEVVTIVIAPEKDAATEEVQYM